MPAFRDYAFNFTTVTTGTTIEIPVPSHQANDLMVAIVTADTGSGTWSAPGWTLQVANTNTAQLAILYRYANTSEPSSYTFTSTVAETYNGAILTIRDVDQTTPFNGFSWSNISTARADMPSITTTNNNCLIVYAIAHSSVSVPSIIEGPVTQITAKDGSAHSDGIAWGFKATAGATANVAQSNIGAAAAKAVTFAIRPPGGIATVIPAYCSQDSSSYLNPINGTTAFNSDLAVAANATSFFQATLNGRTLNNGTVAARADVGLNSFHSMADVQSGTTIGQWSGATLVFATGNRPNITGKNLLLHTRPYLDVDIQTTDSVTLTGAMGVALGVTSLANTDYRVWHVSGADTPFNASLRPIVIHSDNTSGRIQNTGTFNAANTIALGLFVSGKVTAANWIFGSAWLLDTTTVCGGTVSEPVDIPQIVTVASNGHERMSILQQGSSQMMILQPLQIGDGGTNPTYLLLDSTAIEFPEIYNKAAKNVNYCSVDDEAGLTYYAGSTDTIIHRNSVISSKSKYHWTIHVSSSTSATYDFSGTSVIGAGTITLKAGVPMNGITFSQFGTIAANGVSFNGSTFKNVPTGNNTISTNTTTSFIKCVFNTANLAFGNHLISTSTPIIFANSTFTGGTSNGHAIRITSNGTYNFVGNQFNSYGPAARSFNTNTGVNGTTDVITVDSTHGYSNGSAVFYQKHTGTVDVGLTDATMYYVRAIATNQLAFYTTQNNAIADTSRINLTANTTSATHAIYSAGAAIINEATGNVIINVTSGGSTPSVRNTTTSNTVVNNTRTHTVTGLGTGDRVVWIRVSDEAELANQLESSGSASYTYNYISDTPVYVSILSLSRKNREVSVTLGNSDQTLPASQETDPFYSNP